MHRAVAGDGDPGGCRYPDVAATHLYVDNAAMQLVRAPNQFDVMVTTNRFGDILSDCAAMLTGSNGMLPSASLNERGRDTYEPIHGLAPDIAGKGLAKPLATMLYGDHDVARFAGPGELAERIERAVSGALDAGQRFPGTRRVGTTEIGDAALEALRSAG